MDNETILKVLNQNKGKIFIDRLLNRQNYPVINNPNGTYSTHKMAWGQAGNKYYVFPTILWDGQSLREYTPQEAWKHVFDTGNYLEFDTPEEADFFTNNYKKVLGIE